MDSYITFETGEIYQIHDVVIEFIPNQRIAALNYIRYYGGQNSEKTPFNMREGGQNLIVEDGYREFHLRFKNKISKELDELFSNKSFMIDNIKFKMVSYDGNLECFATGYEINKNG